MRKYIEYLGSFYSKATISKTKSNLLRFEIGNHEGRDSLMGAVMPIWAGGAPKPVLVRLIRGKAELLLRMDIVKKLDLAVNFGNNQFNVGKSAWEMMTFNGGIVGCFL